jgi:hypothetical protein
MSAQLLRQRLPKRVRRSRLRHPVETLIERHAELVAERQQLRFLGAGEAALERNRLAIVRCQWDLSHALIERHAPAAAAAAAA